MLSSKQRQIMAFPYTHYDALICDGAIRSGKTSIMIVAFIDDAMRRYDRQQFAICGKTVDSAIKNIIAPYLALGYAKERYYLRWRRAEKLLIVSCKRGGVLVENTFEVFGGKDESSYMIIQGRTLAGVLIDEAALLPRSFVEQAIARCSVEGSRFWFNCNPESPHHWFYTEWIMQTAKHNALRLHFLLEDNPSLSQKIIDRYKASYSGVFYQRYILGEWVKAEGLVYPMFDRAVHVVPAEERSYRRYYVSMDYGTLNPTAMLLLGECGGKWYLVREYYHSGRDTGQQKTDDEYYDALVSLCGGRKIDRIIIDPSAASFITLVRRRGEYHVLPARNDVLPGISATATVLGRGDILINDCCVNTIREFGLYSWDTKSETDRVIKTDDHAMDALRYFVYTLRLADPRPDDKPYVSPFRRG